MSLLTALLERQQKGKKSIAVLIDPDKADDSNHLQVLINLANENCIDFFFVGGSLVTPLTAAGLIGLVLLRLSATSRGLARRRSVARATPSGHHPREGVSGGRDDA